LCDSSRGGDNTGDAGSGISTRSGRWRKDIADFDPVDFSEWNVVAEAVDFQGSDEDLLGDHIPEHVVKDESGNRDQKTRGRRDKHVTDVGGEFPCGGWAGIGHRAEGTHHTKDRTRQTKHGGDDPDNGEVTDFTVEF